MRTHKLAAHVGFCTVGRFNHAVFADVLPVLGSRLLLIPRWTSRRKAIAEQEAEEVLAMPKEKKHVKRVFQCPTCGDLHVLYIHRLITHCITGLGKLVELGPTHIYQHPSFTYLERTCVRRLRWWGLAEQPERRKGVWRATQLGHDFIAGKASVPGVVLVMGSAAKRFIGPPVTLQELQAAPPTVARVQR
jgi:hypothetical protein